METSNRNLEAAMVSKGALKGLPSGARSRHRGANLLASQFLNIINILQNTYIFLWKFFEIVSQQPPCFFKRFFYVKVCKFKLFCFITTFWKNMFAYFNNSFVFLCKYKKMMWMQHLYLSIFELLFAYKLLSFFFVYNVCFFHIFLCIRIKNLQCWGYYWKSSLYV